MSVHRVYFVIAASVAVLGLLLLCVWSPWHLVQAANAHDVTSLPRAPIWNHSEVPGATVNVGRWLLDAVIILLIAGSIVRIGQGTRTKLRQPKHGNPGA